jgi:hypothetical protein
MAAMSTTTILTRPSKTGLKEEDDSAAGKGSAAITFSGSNVAAASNTLYNTDRMEIIIYLVLAADYFTIIQRKIIDSGKMTFACP